jgi:hypothetical protein
MIIFCSMNQIFLNTNPILKASVLIANRLSISRDDRDSRKIKRFKGLEGDLRASIEQRELTERCP